MTELEKQQRIAPQPWMVEPATLAVLEALAGRRRRGPICRRLGARRSRSGQRIGDIDIATPAPPERVIELLEKAGIKVVPTGLDHGTVTAIVAAAAFRDHDFAARCRDLWPPRPRRLRRRLGRRCGAARLHDQRDLSRPRRHDPRSGRRPRRSARAPGPLCRGPRDPHRRGCAAAVAVLPLRGALRHRQRRCARRAPPAAPRRICCRPCRPSAFSRS